MSRIVVPAWRALRLGVALIAATTVSVLHHLELSAGRAALADTVQRLVSGEIAGTLRIASLDRVGLGGVRARGVEILDASGRRVLAVGSATLVPDPGGLLRGQWRIASARLQDVELRLVPGERAVLSLFEAFEPAVPSTPSPGPHVQVDGIVVERGLVHGSMLGLEGIRVEDVQLEGRLEARPTPERWWADLANVLEIHVERGRGRFVAPFPFTGHVERLSASVSTDPWRGLEVSVGGRIERAAGPTDRLEVTLALRTPRDRPPEAAPWLDLQVRPSPARAELLHELGWSWAERLRGSLVGHVRLHGPLDALRLEADAETEAGPVQVRARIFGDATDVEAHTSGVDLARLVADAPDVHVAGRGRLEVRAQPGPAPYVRVELEPFLWGWLAVPGFALEGRLDGEPADRLVVRRVEALHAGGRIDGEGVVRFDGALDVRAHVQLPALQNEPHVRRYVPGVRGALHADVVVRTEPEFEWPRLSGRVRFERLVYGPVRASEMEVRGRTRVAPAGLELDGSMRASSLVLAGEELGSVRLEARGGPRAYRFAIEAFPPGDRRLRASGSVDRDGDRWAARVPSIEVSAGRATWTGALDVASWMPGRWIELDGVRLESGEQRLSGSARIGRRGGGHVAIEARSVDLQSLLALSGRRRIDLGGRLTAGLRLEGPLRDPVLTLEGRLHDAHVGSIRDVEARGAVHYDGAGRLRVELGIEARGRGSLALSGTGWLDRTLGGLVEVLAGGAYEGQLGVEDVDLTLLESIAPGRLPGMVGRLDGQLRFDGSPLAPSLVGELGVSELRLDPLPPLGVAAAIRFEQGTLQTHVQTHAPSAEGRRSFADVEATLLLDAAALLTDPAAALAAIGSQPWSVAIRMPPWRLVEIVPARARRMPEALRPLRVGLSGTFVGGGRPTRGDLTAVLAYDAPLSDDACARDLHPRATVRAVLERDGTRATIAGFLGHARVLDLVATAHTPLDAWLAGEAEPRISEVEVRSGASEVAMHAELGRLPWLCRSLEGEVFVDVRRMTWRPDGIRIEASADVPALRVEGQPVDRLHVEVRVGDDELRLEAGSAWSTSERASVRARLPARWEAAEPLPRLLPGQGWIELRLDRAPLGPFVGWLPQIVDASGRLRGRLRATGSVLDEPRLEGEVVLEDGRLELVGLGQQLDDVAAVVRARDRGVHIERLRARDGQGSIELQGVMDLVGARPGGARVRVRADGFPVRREGTVLATVSAEGVLDAAFGERRAELRVLAERLSVRLPQQSGRTLQPLEPHPDIEIVGAGETGAARSARERPYEIDVAVDARRPFWIRREDFAVQVVAELGAVYVDPELRVAGYANLRRGFFDVFGKRFTVDRGTMNFDGGPELDPIVNLHATHVLRGGTDTVTVEVTGRLSAPTVTFGSSTGATDQGEIIALLVGGARGPMGSERAPREQVSDFLYGVAFGLATLTLRREIGEIVPALAIEQGAGGAGSARVSAGWDVDAIVPPFLRRFIRSAYVQGAVSVADREDPERTASSSDQLNADVLIELGFPYGIVGTGRWSPVNQAWGVDLTWEP
ncbi:MAG: translocation/assembly module TamB domain-containing protein [Myxococcales bacterium]|nr:translocation/assembly module TamB domain-containing protein [Myxococcales bacterium]